MLKTSLLTRYFEFLSQQLTRENAKLKADIEEKKKCHELQLVQNMAEETILEDHGKQEVMKCDVM